MPTAKKYTVTVLTSTNELAKKVIKDLNRDGASKVVEVIELDGNVKATFIEESRRKIKKAAFSFFKRNEADLVAMVIEEQP